MTLGLPRAVPIAAALALAFLPRAFLPPLLVIAHRRFHRLRSEAEQVGTS